MPFPLPLGQDSECNWPHGYLDPRLHNCPSCGLKINGPDFTDEQLDQIAEVIWSNFVAYWSTDDFDAEKDAVKLADAVVKELREGK